MTLDVNVLPRYDVPRWNETRWVGCWSPYADAGVYVHAGRFRHDLDLWWVHLAAYLPGGRLCVNRFWGRNLLDAGVRIGELEIAVREDGWTCSLNAAGQLTSTAALAQRPQGDSAPMLPLRWTISAIPVAPRWDMYGGVEEKLHLAGDTHIQQGHQTSGRLTVGAESFDLDGVGFSDHSSGVRDFGGWASHRFLIVVGHSWVAHLLVVYSPEGVPSAPWGAFFRDGRQVGITAVDAPHLAAPGGAPFGGRLSFSTGDGETYEFDIELLHALPISITADNDNFNGVDWQLEENPLVCLEGKARLTAADGSVAYAYYERSARRDVLPRPDGAATTTAPA